jgi:hypothetical protein
VNDKFEGTYVFDNDFPSVRGGDGDFVQLNEDDLFVAQSNRGTLPLRPASSFFLLFSHIFYSLHDTTRTTRHTTRHTQGRAR